MGPRPFSRGRFCKNCRTAARFHRLQWGHGLPAVEVPSGQRASRAAVRRPGFCGPGPSSLLQKSSVRGGPGEQAESRGAGRRNRRFLHQVVSRLSWMVQPMVAWRRTHKAIVRAWRFPVSATNQVRVSGRQGGPRGSPSGPRPPAGGLFRLPAKRPQEAPKPPAVARSPFDRPEPCLRPPRGSHGPPRGPAGASRPIWERRTQAAASVLASCSRWIRGLLASRALVGARQARLRQRPRRRLPGPLARGEGFGRASGISELANSDKFQFPRD